MNWTNFPGNGGIINSGGINIDSIGTGWNGAPNNGPMNTVISAGGINTASIDTGSNGFSNFGNTICVNGKCQYYRGSATFQAKDRKLNEKSI